ncbi:MAG: trypsin-like serine protease [Myxococcota bacterium]
MLWIAASLGALPGPAHTGPLDARTPPVDAPAESLPIRPAPRAPKRPSIVNGTVTEAHRNVVALARPDGDGVRVFCSGTLVHPEFVVTAAHCVQAFAPGPVLVLFGTDLRSGPAELERGVADAWAHPSYDRANFLNDIGVVQLDAPVLDVAIAAVNDEPPNVGWVGETLRYVGFGDTVDDADDTGVKRTVEVEVTSFDAQYLYAESPDTNTCQGDSGGPAFERAPGGYELAGVNAFTIDGCVGGGNGSTRVDLHLAWLSTLIPELVRDAADVPPVEGVLPIEDPNHPDEDPADTGWGDPTFPTDGTYTKRLQCGHAGSGVSLGGLAGLAMLALRRRSSDPFGRPPLDPRG